MDVDLDVPEAHSEYLREFDLSPSTFPFRPPRPQGIEARRAQLADLLIFDILLTTGGIRQPDTLYPPTDTESLRALLDAIENSTFDTLKKDCLVYFLLKWHDDEAERAERFSEMRCLPPQFVALATAYWHLDTGSDIANAVSILADARLNRDYASKIMQAISLAPTSAPLIVRYVRTAKPLLTEPDDIDMYALALAEHGLWEAWQYQRSFAEGSDVRARLIHKVIEWCITPSPKAAPLAHLLSFPFTAWEQSQVHAYALEPPSSSPTTFLYIIQDLVCVRLIQSGRYAEGIKLDRKLSIAGMQSGKAMQAMQERRRMMDEVMATLPPIERTLLEAELEEPSGGKPTAISGSTPTLGKSRDDLSRSVNSSAPVATPMKPASRPAAPSPFGGPTMGLRANGHAEPAQDLFRSAVPSTFNPVPLSTPAAVPIIPALNQSRGSAPFVPTPSGLGPSRFTASARASASKPVDGHATSLFDSARNANQTPNAFYQPPPNNRAPRERATAFMPNPLSLPVNGTPNEGVTMDTEDEVVLSQRRGASEEAEARDGPPTELSQSIFGTSKSTADARPSAPRAAPRRTRRTTSETMMPPGAFIPDSEEPPASRPTRQSQRRRASPPPAESDPHARPTRSHRAAIEQPTRRTVPGGLMDEEDEEEDDYVAPLPISPPSKRKGRTSRATSEEPVDASRPRRSSRLSRASVSPEPQSPPKQKRKTSKTTGTASVSNARSTRSSRKR